MAYLSRPIYYPFPTCFPSIFNELVTLSNRKLLEHTKFSHIWGVLPYIFPCYSSSLFTQILPILSLFSLPQKAKFLLLPCSSYTSYTYPLQQSISIGILGVSFSPYNNVLSMYSHVYFRHQAPSLAHKRCS